MPNKLLKKTTDKMTGEKKTVEFIAEPMKVGKVSAVDPSRGPCGVVGGDEETGTATTPSITSSDDHDNEMLARRHRSSVSSSGSGFGDLHMLTSYRPGESKIERMAKKIENRINDRVEITFNARRQFLKHCRKIAMCKNYEKISRVKYSDILEWQKEVDDEATEFDAEGIFSRTIHFAGVLSDTQCLATILDKAMTVAKNVELEPDDDFHYQDFNHHHTTLVSRWPWLRHNQLFAIGLVLVFYLLTPILFCVIMDDKGICPHDTKVPGWVSALYFASATMSTVGYGDLSVEKDEPWKVFVGVLYMIASVLIAILAFSAAAETAASPVKALIKRFSPLSYPEGPLKENEYLYQRIRRVKAVMLCDIVLQFTLLNFIGVVASQVFIEYTEVDETRMWNWMDSLYWAVQTTTTIGYGDYAMPDYMRPMQIFYLTLSTYFTGSALGRLSSLKEDLEKIRKYHAFERREVNKNMMHYLASTDDPSRVDMYEFTIASLMNLEKVDYADIAPIMEKFRSLAKVGGHSGYIHVNDLPSETFTDMDDLSEWEGVEGV